MAGETQGSKVLGWIQLPLVADKADMRAMGCMRMKLPIQGVMALA